MKKLSMLITILCSICVSVKAQTDYNDIIEKRLKEIRRGLDSMIFVKRFEAVETPCVCIDSNNNALATQYPNSNYKIRAGSGKLDSGFLCLNRYNAQYARFLVNETSVERMKMSGRVELTYGYPAGSIVQYLGFTQSLLGKDTAYFNRLLRSTGTFSVYPEADRMKIAMTLNTGAFNPADTIYGYLEIASEAFTVNPKTGYMFFFNQMNLQKGDKNNNIFLRFTSTSHNDETNYYARLIAEVLKEYGNSNLAKHAPAVWLYSFLNDPECPNSRYVYSVALNLLKAKFQLPNTQPFPAH